MGFEDEQEEPSCTPKLLLFSQRFNNPELQEGGLTPLPQTISATIPFQWEEAPGKPRSITTANDPPLQKSKSVRYLDLPPRMFASNASSPTSVLQQPYSLCSPDRMVGKSKCIIMMPWSKVTRKEISSPKFSSWSCDSGSRYGSSNGISSFSFDDRSNSLDSKLKINKVSRRLNLLLFNTTTSSIMVSCKVYESSVSKTWSRD